MLILALLIPAAMHLVLCALYPKPKRSNRCRIIEQMPKGTHYKCPRTGYSIHKF